MVSYLVERTGRRKSLAETFSGAAWSGWTLCSFNMMLDITPEAKRPSYVATSDLIGGLTAFVAPLIGGYFAMKYNLRPVMLVADAQDGNGY